MESREASPDSSREFRRVKGYQVLPHTADVGLELFGKSRAELFENAAEGMTALLTDAGKVKTQKKISVRLWAHSWEELLVGWLNEILYWFTVKQMAFKKFKVQCSVPFTLRAFLWGEKLQRGKHPVFREIKAVTYHNLKIKKRNGNYSGKILFDI